ncbi:hypothetical protein PILCRDRAFT_12409 [Piloderma croceum F 1598]|uniref:DUF985 domain-containing protein n=1 Tax=Piloderma croceum (strain F 1598) TaxID=765440 RepID=A0A0C3EWF2_PILCF|nr:hypothetical protein PILCRDRAFT_12409 [Piloderma croceum F 1598]
MAKYDYPSTNQELISDLKLIKHPEGGYFAETDRQKEEVPTPFVNGTPPRSLATQIFYLLTYDNPQGVFHMNKSVTYHVLHQGRAEYTLITPGSPPVIEKKVMGTNVTAGEQRQLFVGTGVWKMSRIPPEDLEAATTQDAKDRTGCLITEVVTPGFHWEDHKFLTFKELQDLFKGTQDGEEKVKSVAPFVKKE